jgi:hypothetical protein
MGTHVVSALPAACSTRQSVITAPPQTGSSKIATINLIHFSTVKAYEADRKAQSSTPATYAMGISDSDQPCAQVPLRTFPTERTMNGNQIHHNKGYQTGPHVPSA